MIKVGQIVGLRNLSNSRYEVIGLSGAIAHLKNVVTGHVMDAVVHLLEIKEPLT